MKKSPVFIIMLLALCCFCVSVKAQTPPADLKNYFFLPYDYSFCEYSMTQMSISLPANWGFQVPNLKEHAATLKIDNNSVKYEPDYSALQGQTDIWFISPEGTQPCLKLQISNFDAEPAEQSATIKSDFGTFQKADESLPNYETFQLARAGYFLTFSILTHNETEKKICRDIIASATDCSYLDDGDWAHTEFINYYAGDSTYYPELGLAFVVPVNMSAQIVASRYKINEATTLLTNYSTLDALLDRTAGDLNVDKFKMSYSFEKRHHEFTVEKDIENMIEDRLRNFTADCRYIFDCSVDGIACKGFSEGSVVQTICFIIPADNYMAIFNFEDMRESELDKLENIMTKITIDSAFRSSQDRVSSTASLKDLVWKRVTSPMIIPALSLNNKSSYKALLACEIPEIGVTLYIPRFDETYTSDNAFEDHANTKKSATVTLHHRTSSNDPDEPVAIAVADDYYGDYDSYSSPRVSTSNLSENIRITLDIPEEAEGLTAEEFYQQLFSLANCIESAHLTRNGVYTVGNQKWYHCALAGYDSEYDEEMQNIAIFITDYKNTVVEIMIEQYGQPNDFEKTVKNMEALLKKASFK